MKEKTEPCCNNPEFNNVDLKDKPPFLYCKNCEAEWTIHYDEVFTAPIEDVKKV
jgi:transcription elongation factor Elf1